MNFETIGEAMQLVYDNKDAKFDEIVDILKQNGFDWTVEEAQKYHAFRMMHGAKTLNLGDGMLAGDLSTGATFVANCSTSEFGWAFCRDWIPDVPSEGSAVSWLKAHEEQAKQMSAKIEEMGVEKPTVSQAVVKVDAEDDVIITKAFAEQYGLHEDDHFVDDVGGRRAHVSGIVDAIPNGAEMVLAPEFSSPSRYKPLEFDRGVRDVSFDVSVNMPEGLKSHLAQDRLEKFGDPTLGIEAPIESDTPSDDFGSK